MDYSSDDSMDDPDFCPSIESYDDSSESDSGNEAWNPPPTSRRISTFSEDLPALPDIQRRRTPRSKTMPPDDTVNLPSTSGATSTEISESEWVKQKIENLEWVMPTADDPEQIPYTVPFSGMKDIYTGILANANPIDYFDLFLTRDIVEHIVEQTNLFATQNLLDNNDVGPQARAHSWYPVTVDEMLKFLALIGWMGLVKLPAIKDYWRVHKLYGLPLARTVMPRNRFELILKYIHFSDNTEADTEDRLCKIRDVLDKFIENYKKMYTPGEDICVDESLIPWRGRLIFRQYIPNKAAKYGIKVFKLCTEKGYTWNLYVYCGKSKEKDVDVSEKTVMTLAQGLLDEGRTIYTDNYYTSVPLAYRLRRRKTHLVGTLRSNRKHLPKDVIAAKLKRGEMSCKQTKDGIVVLKWRDKRDVRMLTTKTSGLKTEVTQTRKRTPIIRPVTISNYNSGKTSIDISDQMATYGSALRRCTKWYRKLFIEVLWGTSLVNAHFLYNKYSTKKKLTITEFREQVITGLLDRHSQPCVTEPGPSTSMPRRASGNVKHYLVKNKVGEKAVRGRCSECYKKYGRKGIEVNGKVVRASQVNTKCSVCDVIICKTCFNNTH
ncbi:piggyBac transposable element-derived protein 4-like [Melitaea cinxia]|uniref:piggyBac transposable element-derived protein 4-like n=1 Tax=Melitaea cinxia TaxID=113334 RepID=UPI001E270044|nr:piggyBac transposable element-derived protein 4-like [Melitaea cinxia]